MVGSFLKSNYKALVSQLSHISSNIDQYLPVILAISPGIYNSPFRDPDPMEFELRKVRACHMTPPRPQIQQTDYEDLSSWLACTSKRSFPRSDILPPINRKQYQGPFRDIAEVLQQRYKPLQPTLRVATSINSLRDAQEELKREEWKHRVNDNM
ncbi:spermatogenesis-associated protein 17-like [Sarcophilus harrisii]|uniref:spermatogenesis-associated protein 17-like n=1 Tax=Sarcophilus harrisii TaxID=9305 RepID=UPI001301EF60|nr:spermatogenesis-associated protein 17-like [Sarcophilus harrisii]